MAVRKFQKIIWYLELLPRLGVWNVLYVFFYRIKLRSGYFKWKTPVLNWKGEGAVFTGAKQRHDFPDVWKKALLEQADQIVEGSLPYFAHHWMEQSSPPNWFLNPFNGKICKESGRHWSGIRDFNEELGDIKCLWEASRFSWLGILARAHVVSGNKIYLDTINEWLDDWIIKNPVNQGPNWKCGQEASFRVLALLNAAFILGQMHKTSDKLREMIILHLRRISSNIGYAFAQRNNHATSEAAALFIGGNWLLRTSVTKDRRHRRYARQGRKYLERLVKKLSYEDGSFSQHSIIYHRLLLDTLSFALFWNKVLDLRNFSTGFHQHAELVFGWLYSLVDESGDCPNLGPNDGTMLQSNHSCDYRDFRPSLQLASVLLKESLIYDDGPCNEILYWAGLQKQGLKTEAHVKSNRLFKSGYAVMKASESWALLRFPYFKFRPSHNDAMHFDLWANGRNLLFDSGSYSYNPPRENRIPDLKSVHAHNTLSFDHREQMPRLGRFLLARWLQPHEEGEMVRISDTTGTWRGSYIDAAGNLHRREVEWNDNNWEIHDVFTGTAKNVEIGFNFSDEEYTLDQKENSLVLPWGRIRISNQAELSVRSHMVSRYYFESRASKRLIISTINNSEIITSIEII